MQRVVLKTSLVLTYISIGFFLVLEWQKYHNKTRKALFMHVTFRLGNWSTLGLFSKFIGMIKSLNPIVFTFRLLSTTFHYDSHLT